MRVTLENPSYRLNSSYHSDTILCLPSHGGPVFGIEISLGVAKVSLKEDFCVEPTSHDEKMYDSLVVYEAGEPFLSIPFSNAFALYDHIVLITLPANSEFREPY